MVSRHTLELAALELKLREKDEEIAILRDMVEELKEELLNEQLWDDCDDGWHT